jgi:hypothetical protein
MGNRSSQPTLATQAADMRYDAAVLGSRAKLLETDAVKARTASAAAYKAGNEPVARTHARSMLTAQKSAATFYAMSARLAALSTKLAAVEATASLAAHMATLAVTLKAVVTQEQFQDIEVTMSSFDKAMAEIERAASGLEKGLDAHVGISDADVDRELAVIQDAAGLELDADMPEAASSALVTAKADDRQLQERYALLVERSPPR